MEMKKKICTAVCLINREIKF